jgi:hypothetical protein
MLQVGATGIEEESSTGFEPESLPYAPSNGPSASIEGGEFIDKLSGY